MTVKLLSFYVFRRFGAALLIGSAGSSVHAAMLGDIHLRSALGERFDATVTVAAADDEDLTSNCFRLVAPQDEYEGSVLRRARLIYQHEVNGGRLIIRGEDSIQEPVLTVSLRVKCPGEEERVFQRDYRVLLDPREYRPMLALPTTSTVQASTKSASRRKLPTLGTAWLSEEGDTVAKIAASYYPNDKNRQQLLVQAIYELNPDLPQNTNARLGSDWRLQLPSPIAKPEVIAAPKQSPKFDAPAPKELDQPRLTLDSEASPTGVAPSSGSGAATGEFRLRLSDSSLDTQRKSTLTPEQTLQLRERLLSLESDEQAAQMLQLKYQVAELEKQLSSLRGNAPATSATMQDKHIVDRETGNDSPSWLWWILGGLLLLIPVLLFLLRRWQRRDGEEDEPFSMISPSTAYVSGANQGLGNNTTSYYGRSSSAGGLDTREIGTPIHRNESEEWHSEDMDVVSPGNVTEEAQLLLDHGLTPQAINLLSHEINQYPAALALWMKLFEIFHRNAMPEAYQERAVAFRLQFASDSLWQKVQELGRELDPANPLYRSLDTTSDIALQLGASTVSQPVSDDLAFASALHKSVGLDAPESLERIDEHDLTEHFALDIDVDSADLDDSNDSILYAAPNIDEEQIDAIELVSLDDGTSDQFTLLEQAALQAQPEAEIIPLLPKEAVAASSTASSFQSDDPDLKEVARLIDAGQRKEAFKQLEEMLYKGNMSQRLTASKWLDRMIGTFGNG